MWVPGQSQVAGNQEADNLAKVGSKTPLLGQKPVSGSVSGISQETEKQEIKTMLAKRATTVRHEIYLKKVSEQKHVRALLEKPYSSTARTYLSLNRTEIVHYPRHYHK